MIPATSPNGRCRLVVSIIIGLSLAGVANVLLPMVDVETRVLINGSLFPLVAVGAGIALMRAATRQPGEQRTAWALIGAGVTAWGVGEAIWQWYVLTDREVPYPGLADGFYLLGYPLVAWGIVRLPHIRMGRYERLRLALDVAAGTLSLGALLWLTLISDIFASGSGSTMQEQFVNLMYPSGDVILLVALMILTLRRSPLRFDKRLIALGASVAFTAAADVVYLVQIQAGVFEDASPLDALWFVYYGGMAFTAWLLLQPTAASPVPHRRPAGWQLAAPYAPVIGLFSLTLAQVDGQSAPLQVTSGVVSALIIARQGVSIKETRELVERQRDDLVASVSHELRTPLTAVQGFAQLLTSSWDLLDEPQRRVMIATIEDQATHLGRLTADLIEVARDRLHTTSLTLVPVTADSIVNSAIEGAPTGSNVVVETDIDEVTITVDPTRMRQVIGNLVTNAARYGDGRIDVIVRSDQGARIEVHDNGPGVPKRYEASIWERFERGAHALNSATPGSGLGLSVAQSIVQAHGGTIRYQRSDRLGGAAFIMELPTVAQASAPHNEPVLANQTGGG
jgi:signal transduction histidine kinase